MVDGYSGNYWSIIEDVILKQHKWEHDIQRMTIESRLYQGVMLKNDNNTQLYNSSVQPHSIFSYRYLIGEIMQ